MTPGKQRYLRFLITIHGQIKIWLIDQSKLYDVAVLIVCSAVLPKTHKVILNPVFWQTN